MDPGHSLRLQVPTEQALWVSIPGITARTFQCSSFLGSVITEHPNRTKNNARRPQKGDIWEAPGVA